MITTGAMASARRRTVRSMLVCALLALAGGGPAPRAAYAEVSAAVLVAQPARSSWAAAVAHVAAPSAARSTAPRRTRSVTAASARAQLVVARLYLAHSAWLL